MSFRASSSQKKTEILVVTPGFVMPDDNARHIAGELITAIARRSPFHFTWAAHGGRGAPDLPGHTILPMQGWRAIENPFGLRWPFWNRESRLALRQAVAGTDLVWLHDTLYPGALATLRMARALNKPVLVTQHDSPASYAAHTPMLSRAWLRLTDNLVTGRVLRRAQQVVFSSTVAARHHRGVKFLAPAKIIPSGLESSVFQPPSAEVYRTLRTRFALRDDQPVLLYAGRFESASGLPIIRHLAERLPKWRFWVAGRGRIKPETWYLPNVQVFRNRSGAPLAELFQAADLLVQPGSGPETPGVLHKAAASQLPIMCSAEAVAGKGGLARCLVVNTTARSPERIAAHWVEKLKAGRDVWPSGPEEGAEMLFDSGWDWPEIAAHYTEIIASLSRPAA